MNIVITGITGFHNRGVEALATSIIEQLNYRSEGHEIIVLTGSPHYDGSCEVGANVGFVLSNFHANGGRKIALRKALAAALGRDFIPQPRSNAAVAIRDASIVIATGGDVFSSAYGNLHTHLLPLELAQRHHVPVVFLAQSIGPFWNRAEAEAWKRIAGRAVLVTLRESSTFRYVTEDLGLTNANVHLTSDPAFLLRSPEEDRVRQLCAYYNLDQSRPLVGLSISQGISQFARIGETEHFEAWCQVVHALLEETGAQVMLVPHVQSASARNDDRRISTMLLRRFEFDSRVRLIGGDHSAIEFKGLLGACDMVIAERMHAAIAALSSAVPVVAVQYSVKAEGILIDVLRDDAIASDYLLTVEDLVEATAGSCERILNAWRNRQSLQRTLAANLPDVRSRATQNFDLLMSVLPRE